MRTYAATHIGRVRTTNEDAYYLPRPGERFVVIADGMGGHLAGEVASTLAVERFAETLRAAVEPDEDMLRAAVEAANRGVFEAAREDPLKHGMGTTLTAVWLGADEVCLAHVGDSRAYLLRNRALMQLTNDHSLVGELVEKGEITPEEALTHPQRNLITRALGTEKRVEPDILRIDHRPDDVWLLCTDGLSNYLRSHEIAEILLRCETWQQKLEEIILLALQRGGGDNITGVLVTGEEAAG